MLAFAAVLALVPTPIGVGPQYHPPPAIHGACGTGALHASPRVHLELFANGRVVIVPAALGLRGARFSFGRVAGATCRARAWTTDPSGVVAFDAGVTLADVFGVWGRPLAPTRLLSFRGVVRVYRNGERVRVDPRRAVLHDRDELVLEVGPYVPPHRAYSFPPH